MKNRLTFLFILITFFTYCAEVEWSLRHEGANIASSSVIEVIDGDYDNLNTANYLTDVQDFGYVRFGIGEKEMASFSSDNIDLLIDLKITIYDNNYGITSVINNKVLKTTFNIDGIGNSVNMDEYRMNGVHKFDVEVNSITATVAGLPVALPM